LQALNCGGSCAGIRKREGEKWLKEGKRGSRRNLRRTFFPCSSLNARQQGERKKKKKKKKRGGGRPSGRKGALHRLRRGVEGLVPLFFCQPEIAWQEKKKKKKKKKEKRRFGGKKKKKGKSEARIDYSRSESLRTARPAQKKGREGGKRTTRQGGRKKEDCVSEYLTLLKNTEVTNHL